MNVLDVENLAKALGQYFQFKVGPDAVAQVGDDQFEQSEVLHQGHDEDGVEGLACSRVVHDEESDQASPDRSSVADSPRDGNHEEVLEVEPSLLAAQASDEVSEVVLQSVELDRADIAQDFANAFDSLVLQSVSFLEQRDTHLADLELCPEANHDHDRRDDPWPTQPDNH